MKKKEFKNPEQKPRYSIRDIYEMTAALPVNEIIESYGTALPKRSGNSLLGLCPFHADTHYGSFVVTPSKGIYCCFVCGPENYAGNGVHFVKNLLDCSYRDAALHTALKFGLISNEEYEYYRSSSFNPMKSKEAERKYSARKLEEAKNAVPMADAQTVHYVYVCMKNACGLKPGHFKMLTQTRKIPEKRVNRDYFSFPSSNEEKEHVITSIRNELSYITDEELSRVPGFFYDRQKEKITFNSVKGIGILIRDEKNMVAGIQIRRDSVDSYDQKGTGAKRPRYCWFSSGWAAFHDALSGGTSPGSPVDVLFPKKASDNGCITVTEGRFKSEILALYGNTSLSVQGAGNWKEIGKTIKAITEKREEPVKNIWIFYDSDMFQNHRVFEHAAALAGDLMKKFPDIPVGFAVWKTEYGKGIDDCILNGHVREVKFINDLVFLKKAVNSSYLEQLEKRHVESESELDKEELYKFRSELLEQIEKIIL